LLVADVMTSVDIITEPSSRQAQSNLCTGKKVSAYSCVILVWGWGKH